VRHVVAGPLVGDEHGQAHRAASFTYRTTGDRLSTPPSSVARRSPPATRANSASSSPNGHSASASPRSILSCSPQFAASAQESPGHASPAGLAYPRDPGHSRSNFRRLSGTTPDPPSPCLHDLEGRSHPTTRGFGSERRVTVPGAGIGVGMGLGIAAGCGAEVDAAFHHGAHVGDVFVHRPAFSEG